MGRPHSKLQQQRASRALYQPTRGMPLYAPSCHHPSFPWAVRHGPGTACTAQSPCSNANDIATASNAAATAPAFAFTVAAAAAAAAAPPRRTGSPPQSSCWWG